MPYIRTDMPSIKTSQCLANILGQHVLISQSLQAYRQGLARIEYYDCIGLFRYLDQDQKGYLRQKDFQRIIGTNHRKLLTYSFSWFDCMKVGEVTRLQFATFLLPKDDLQLRNLLTKKIQTPYQNPTTILAQFQLFSKMVVHLMNQQMKVIQMRYQLLSYDDYTLVAAMRAIDTDSKGWITTEDIYQFLKNYGYNVTLRQVEKLVQATNSSLDGKITKNQLQWIIQGFQNKSKQYLNKVKNTNKKVHNRPTALQLDYLDNTPIRSTKIDNFDILLKQFRIVLNQQQQIQAQIMKQQYQKQLQLQQDYQQQLARSRRNRQSQRKYIPKLYEQYQRSYRYNI